MLTCKICGKEVHQLTNHLKHTHNVTKEQYKSWYGNDVRFVSEELSTTFSKSAINHKDKLIVNLNKSSRKQGKKGSENR